MSLPMQHFYVNLKIKNKSASVLTRDVQLESQNLEYLTITEHVLSILPKIEMVINDVGGLSETFPLLDDDVMSVIISQFDDGEPMIDLDFIISDYVIDSDNGANHFNKLKLVGYLYSTDMFVPYRNRVFNDNSENVLKRIAFESNISFENPLNVKSNDKMKWYQNESNYQFIKHILKRSYIPNDTVLFYANTKNKFIYTSLVSEMNKQTNFNAKFSSERVDNFILDSNENNIMFFNSYDIVNFTGLFNKLSNYSTSYGYYDLKGNYFINQISNSMPKFTDLYNKNKKYDKRPTFINLVNYFNNTDSFPEYSKAKVQNDFYKYNFFKMSLILNINSMTNIKLFDKVDVSIPSVLDGINEVHSGEYLVVALTHNITADGVYQKKPMLCRNGINKSNTLREYDVN